MTKKEVLHTEEIKKKYSKVEQEIKRNLTEVMLMNEIGTSENVSRGLSITKDFKIRELGADENSKYLSNPSTIKSGILTSTAESIQENLFRLIESEVDDKNIAQKYKSGISDFFEYITTGNVQKLSVAKENSPLFVKYLSQSRETKNIKKRNIKLQVAKLLYEKFGDSAFTKKLNKKKDNEYLVVFSEKSLNYICTIFSIANKVREARGKRIDQVFHDGDFPFITKNIKVSESDYIDVMIYLLDRGKLAYYGKRGIKGQKERSKKTSQYADILWSLTNNQLRIHEYTELGEGIETFHWDDITKNLLNVGGGLLDNMVITHNEYNPSKKLRLSKRLKSASSCAEKIIEGKKINDAIGLRLSMKGISDQNFDDIKKISKSWFQTFNASLKAYPNKYVHPGETIAIKKVSIDNKGILEQEQIEDILFELNKIVPTEIRKKLPSPYINETEWIKRMHKYYPEVVNNPQAWETVQAFYKEITGGKVRGRNGSYKDFKFNITFEISDQNGESIGERNMEVQFDDINNGKGLSNYNIRNFERRLNTQSRLSFSVSLSDARKHCEENLKQMWLWAKKWSIESKTKDEQKELFEISFPDGFVANISGFGKRNKQNAKIMDETIVKIINYFIQKGTFILCYDPIIQEQENFKPISRLLTVEDLHNSQMMKNLHICSSLELASQQHSYLQQNRDRKVGIYLEEQQDFGWISLGELINPMNLGKKKDEEYSIQL